MLMAGAVVKPIPRPGVAIGSGTTQQRSPVPIVDNENFTPGNQMRALNAKPFVIKRFPLPPAVA
jgi:hypothetical protein